MQGKNDYQESIKTPWWRKIHDSVSRNSKRGSVQRKSASSEADILAGGGSQALDSMSTNLPLDAPIIIQIGWRDHLGSNGPYLEEAKKAGYTVLLVEAK